MRESPSPAQNLNAAFQDAGAPALREFLENPTSPPTAAVTASIIQSVLLIEQHLIEQASKPEGPFS